MSQRRSMRAQSKKAASELPEAARANFLTAAAKLFSTSLATLSTHLGQQALRFADSQQLLASSLAANSQLCRKCGSPLNIHTCSDVHIAWLPASARKRLSKKLPAAAADRSSAGRQGAAAAASRQRNTVAAVRVCVACQHPSVRPFLSVALAHKHLAKEGFENVPVTGMDPQQQAAADREKKKKKQQQQLQQQRMQAEAAAQAQAQQQQQQLQQHRAPVKRAREDAAAADAADAVTSEAQPAKRPAVVVKLVHSTPQLPADMQDPAQQQQQQEQLSTVPVPVQSPKTPQAALHMQMQQQQDQQQIVTRLQQQQQHADEGAGDSTVLLAVQTGNTAGVLTAMVAPAPAAALLPQPAAAVAPSAAPAAVAVAPEAAVAAGVAGQLAVLEDVEVARPDAAAPAPPVVQVDAVESHTVDRKQLDGTPGTAAAAAAGGTTLTATATDIPNVLPAAVQPTTGAEGAAAAATEADLVLLAAAEGELVLPSSSSAGAGPGSQAAAKGAMSSTAPCALEPLEAGQLEAAAATSAAAAEAEPTAIQRTGKGAVHTLAGERFGVGSIGLPGDAAAAGAGEPLGSRGAAIAAIDVIGQPTSAVIDTAATNAQQLDKDDVMDWISSPEHTAAEAAVATGAAALPAVPDTATGPIEPHAAAAAAAGTASTAAVMAASVTAVAGTSQAAAAAVQGDSGEGAAASQQAADVDMTGSTQDRGAYGLLLTPLIAGAPAATADAQVTAPISIGAPGGHGMGTELAAATAAAAAADKKMAVPPADAAAAGAAIAVVDPATAASVGDESEHGAVMTAEAAPTVTEQPIATTAAPDAATVRESLRQVQTLSPSAAAAALSEAVAADYTVPAAAAPGQMQVQAPPPAAAVAAAAATASEAGAAGNTAPTAAATAAAHGRVHTADAAAPSKRLSSAASALSQKVTVSRKAAAARLSAQLWPVAPVMMQSPETIQQTTHNLLVITDNKLVDTEAGGAGVGTAGGSGDASSSKGSSSAAAAAAAAAVASSAAADRHLRQQEQQQGTTEPNKVQADSQEQRQQQLGQAGSRQDAPPSVSAPAVASGESAGAEFAAQGKQSTTQMAETAIAELNATAVMNKDADISSPSADGRGDSDMGNAEQHPSQETAAAAVPAAAAAAAAATTAAVAADAVHGSGSADRSGTTTPSGGSSDDEADGDAEDASAISSDGVPYMGPWAGGVRPAHAISYSTDSPSVSISAGSGGSVRGTSARDGLLQDMDEEMASGDADDGSEGDRQTEDSADAGQQQQQQDEGVTQEDGLQDSSGEETESGSSENEEQERIQADEGDAAAAVKEQGTEGVDSVAVGGQYAAVQQGVRLQQQQQQQRSGNKRSRKAARRQRRQQAMLRSVCARSHLLHKRVGRRALRHLVYRGFIKS